MGDGPRIGYARSIGETKGPGPEPGCPCVGLGGEYGPDWLGKSGMYSLVGWRSIWPRWGCCGCGQEVAWHERMDREAVVGLRGEDLVEESLECMARLFDQIEREPSR